MKVTMIEELLKSYFSLRRKDITKLPIDLNMAAISYSRTSNFKVLHIFNQSKNERQFSLTLYIQKGVEKLFNIKTIVRFVFSFLIFCRPLCLQSIYQDCLQNLDYLQCFHTCSCIPWGISIVRYGRVQKTCHFRVFSKTLEYPSKKKKEIGKKFVFLHHQSSKIYQKRILTTFPKELSHSFILTDFLEFI